MYAIFTYVNPRGIACINFTEETDMIYKRAEPHYGNLKKVCGGIADYDRALSMINAMAREKGYDIAG
jgi:hypothetical protein